MSTTAVDSYHTIIRPTGFDLSRFKLNPVMLWAHDQSRPNIGRWDPESLVADATGLAAQAEFNDLKFSQQICSLYETGFLRGFSVCGAITGATWFWDDEEQLGELEDWEFEALRSGDADGVITGIGLWEISGCNIPANPFALSGGARTAAGEGAAGASLERVLERLVISLEALVLRKKSDPDEDDDEDADEVVADDADDGGDDDGNADVEADADDDSEDDTVEDDADDDDDDEDSAEMSADEAADLVAALATEMLAHK